MNKKILLTGWIVIVLAFLIFIGWGVSVLQNKSTTSNNSTPQTNKEFEAKVAALRDMGTVNPWPHSDSSTNPSLPSSEALNNIYLEVRRAYSDRDYNLYKEYASAERIWHMEHNKELEAGTYNNQLVFSTIAMEGEKNFIDNSLLLCVYNAPAVNDLNPVNVEIDSEERNVARFLLVDYPQSQRTNVEGQEWLTRIKLNYEIKENPYLTGSGSVFFVYDDGTWKYHFESWNITYKELTAVGDPINDGDNVIVIGKQSDTYAPESVSVNVGGIVTWQNVRGIIYTVDPSTSHWNSPFVNNADYSKRFTEPGSYKYLINDSFNKIFEGEINVN